MNNIELLFRSSANSYDIYKKDELVFSINKKDLKITGKDFFEKFYKNQTFPLSYVLKTECNDKADNIIFNQLKDLFSKVDQEILSSLDNGENQKNIPK